MVTGAANIVLKGSSKNISKFDDLTSMMDRSGIDFRAARRAAEQVGSQIVLGVSLRHS